jgi:outer membrane protein
MKNISLYLNIVLIIAVSLLYIDRFAGGGTEEQNVQSGNSSGTGAEVVYINIDSLLNGFDLYNELKIQGLSTESYGISTKNREKTGYFCSGRTNAATIAK